MRLIKLLLLVGFLMSGPMSHASLQSVNQSIYQYTSDTQVRINGWVATFQSVVNYCGGDTATAISLSTPLPVEAPYLSAGRVNAERFYNAVNPAWLCVTAALIGLLCPASAVLAIVLMLFVAGDFALRWWLGGSVPLVGVVDMAGAIALLLSAIALRFGSMRRWIYLLIALLMICVAVWGVHPAVRPVNPALQSVWLPIHVSLMVVAYSLFMVSAIAAVVSPIGSRIYRCILGGELSLSSGIAVGSLWAAEAWGRYWAWDPKETSALITLLIYIGVLAAWSKLREHPVALRLVVALSFLAVVFTWIGISGGLHAY